MAQIPNNTFTGSYTFHTSGGTITSPATWAQYAGVSTYYVDGSVTANAGVTLTLAAGMTYLMGSGASLIANGALIAPGTASQPIIFTSNQPVQTTGYWGGVAANGAGGQIGYVTISFAGASSTTALAIAATIPVSNVTIANVSYYGINVSGGVSPSFSNITIATDLNAGIELNQTSGWRWPSPALPRRTSAAIGIYIAAGPNSFTT